MSGEAMSTAEIGKTRNRDAGISYTLKDWIEYTDVIVLLCQTTQSASISWNVELLKMFNYSLCSYSVAIIFLYYM